MPGWYVVAETPGGALEYWPVLAWAPESSAVQWWFQSRVRMEVVGAGSDVRMEYRPDMS
jgi:hypothetical protein